MPENARVCRSMPMYARVCKSMPEYARVCQSITKYARVCQSMPEYNRAEKRANKLHEKLQEACSNLSELASCADQTNYEFYDLILDFVDKVKMNDEARKKAEKMKTPLSTKGIVTQQSTH